MKLRLALEWFLNPDHLPFLVGLDKGLYKEKGIDLEIIEPQDHYDGLLELAKGNIELATNEPLHLVEKYQPNILSLANFFETQGGIIFTEQGYQKLLSEESFQISSPVSNPVTDSIALDIVERHMLSLNKKFTKENCKILVKDFYHIKNLQAGMDAAWLCFENFEGVEAEEEALAVKKVYLEDVGIPNFCALDLFTNKSFAKENAALLFDFRQSTERAIEILSLDYEYCKVVFYKQAGQEPSPLMDKIIKDTYQRFLRPMAESKTKWMDLYKYVRENKISELKEEEYENLFHTQAAV